MNTTRQYYENLKWEFANKKSYYGNRDENWGEEYGYALAPPYKEFEIEEYEKKYNVKIPSNLRNYLVNISRETLGHYPYIVDLDEPPIKDKVGGEKLSFIQLYENGCTDDDYVCISKDHLHNGKLIKSDDEDWVIKNIYASPFNSGKYLCG